MNSIPTNIILTWIEWFPHAELKSQGRTLISMKLICRGIIGGLSMVHLLYGFRSKDKGDVPSLIIYIATIDIQLNQSYSQLS